MILGLQYLDFSIIIVFLIAVLWVGIRASKKVKQASDFYLGGRKMGKALQFFINFGNATDTNGAPTMAGQVYGQGVAGIWLQLQTLFITPLFWFTQPWFRRARVTTMADLFIDRFNSKSVASAYAIFNIMVALLTLGLGNYAAYSVVEGMMLKPKEQYTLVEQTEVATFQEVQTLKAHDLAKTLTPEESVRLEELRKQDAKTPFRSQIPALSKAEFYITYNLIVAIYIMLGGLHAAAITDAIQGILILIMSVILLPIGLYKAGGFWGLHHNIHVPQTSFWLAGTAFSDFTWYAIAAVTFTSFIQVMGLQHNMASAGSATNENTARFGMIVGGFTKRIILICWMMCGLLALALLVGDLKLDKPDFAWGRLSAALLPTGLFGIMLSGMLLGHMPAVGLTSVAVSGLVARNVYEPLFPGQSAKHYLRVGQITIFFVLASSVAIAWYATSLGSLTTIMITFNTIFGAAVFLMFFWRRLTVPAILISFAIWVVLQAAIPIAIGFSSLNRNETLTVLAHPRDIPYSRGATEADVQAGKAAAVGESINDVLPKVQFPLFFDGKIVPVDLKDPSKGNMGTGRFLIENFVMYYPLKAVGIDMGDFPKPVLFSVRWLFDGVFPFIMLIVFSLVTKPVPSDRAAGFYVKQKTAVAPTPELDHEEVERSLANPARFDDTKLFPHSNWEFCRWTKNDYLGFFGCCAIALAILSFLWIVLHIGS